MSDSLKFLQFTFCRFKVSEQGVKVKIMLLHEVIVNGAPQAIKQSTYKFLVEMFL